MNTTLVINPLVFLLLFPVVGEAANVGEGILNTFTPNTTISSDQVNKNFTTLKDAVNSKQEPVQPTCAAPSMAIKTINPDGTVTCETVVGKGLVDSVSGGSGLVNVGGNTAGAVTLAIDPPAIQTEAKNAMGAKSNTNAYFHDRYTDANAISAMGDTLNTNPLNHDRFTNTEVVNAIKGADGAGSGLDADLLDGKNSSNFAGSNQNCAAGSVVTGINTTGGLVCEPPALRFLPGIVNAALGTPTFTGFTVTNTATGTYKITFTTAFNGTPAVTANAWTQDAFVRIRLVSSTDFEMDLINTSGVKINGGFHFIAIGKP